MMRALRTWDCTWRMGARPALERRALGRLMPGVAHGWEHRFRPSRQALVAVFLLILSATLYHLPGLRTRPAAWRMLAPRAQASALVLAPDRSRLYFSTPGLSQALALCSGALPLPL